MCMFLWFAAHGSGSGLVMPFSSSGLGATHDEHTQQQLESNGAHSVIDNTVYKGASQL